MRGVVHAGLLGLGLLAFYTWNAYPVVAPYRDSGDLAAAAVSLGIPHPPGYPLYTLFGKAVLGLLPFGNPAYRLNWMSGLFAGLASAVLGLWVMRRSGLAVAGWAAGLAWGLSPATVSLASVSEMYTQAAAAAALLLFLCYGNGTATTQTSDPSPPRSLAASSYFLGLFLGGHQTIGAWGAGILMRAGLRPRLLFRLALWGLAGFSLYAFLVVRSFGEPLLDWGDPQTPRNLWRVLTRADLGAIRLHPDRSPLDQTPAEAALHFLGYLREQAREMAVLPAVLGLAGLAFACRRRLPSAWLLGVVWLLSGPIFFLVANLPAGNPTSRPILEPYFLLAGIPLLACLGFLGDVEETPLVRRLAWWGCALGVIASLFWSGLRFWRGEGLHRDGFYGYDFGRDLLRTLPPGSLILGPDDPTEFTMKYIQVAEGRRPDIRSLVFYRTRWGYEQIRNRWPDLLAGRQADSGPVLERILLEVNVSRGLYVDHPHKAPPGYAASSRGILYRLSAVAGASPFTAPGASSFTALGASPSYAPASFAPVSSAVWEMYTQRRLARPDFFSRQVQGYYAWARNNLGLEFHRAGLATAAQEQFQRALALDPSLAEAHSNLGISYLEQGKALSAAEAFRAAAKLKPTPWAFRNLGLSLLEAQDPVAAEGALREAARLAPRDAAVLSDLGVALMRQRRYWEAEAEFRKAVESDPGYALAWENLKEVLVALGRDGEAAEAGERARRMRTSTYRNDK